MSKAMTLRLSEELARELEAVARVRGTSMAHAVRIAVAHYLADLAADPDFQARLAAALEEEREVLQRLAREDDRSGGAG
jgi:predicted transcriptional regulator